MDWHAVVRLGLTYPGMVVGRSYGTPGLLVRTKLVTRLRPADGSLVLLEVPVEEREMLIAADPAVFHTTPHYAAYPAVLARLAAIDTELLRPFLDRRYRLVAGARLLREWGQ